MDILAQEHVMLRPDTVRTLCVTGVMPIIMVWLIRILLHRVHHLNLPIFHTHTHTHTHTHSSNVLPISKITATDINPSVTAAVSSSGLHQEVYQ